MAFMTFDEYKKLEAKKREIEKYKLAANQNSSIKSDAYKDDQYDLGKLRLAKEADDRLLDYNNSMAQAYDASQGANQDAKGWKLLADQAIKDDSMYTTNEGDAYRQKELLAVRARKKKIVQEIDELKKELQQRTQLQAYEDRYKDSPIWKLAKKQYIDTGDLSPIESFVTRENALEESMKTRDFTGRENELNRKNTLDINRAQKTEQYEYNLYDAQEKVELAQNKLKSTKALGIPSNIKDAQISFNSAVKRLNNIREKMGMEDSEYVLEEYEESGKKESVGTVRSVKDIIYSLPDKYRYKTKAEKAEIMLEIEAHPAFKDQDEELLKAYNEIKKTKTREERKADNAAYLEKARNYWKGLKPIEKSAYQAGEITYNKNNEYHVALDKNKGEFRIKWKGGK